MSNGWGAWPARRGDVRIEVTPIATPAGARLGIEVTNRGGKALGEPRVDVRPAPPAVCAHGLAAVVPASAGCRERLCERLGPGESRATEVDCPLRPGPLYRRVLALDPDDDEPVYGLPIETLLWIEVRWHERILPGWWRRGRRRLLRGRFLEPWRDD